MADVFISYSRRDEEFVQRLRAALAASGKDVWVDREDIGPAVEWRREIELGIEGADIFAFVMTPEALRSEPCRREREYALAKNKRIVPLLRREPDGLAVPDDLASRNFIFFRTDEEFAPGFASLLAAIDDLPEWARRHTRLLERAEEWDHGDRDASLLLRGSDLRQAERWLSERPAHTEPQPTPLQAEYVLCSRNAATRRQRLTIAAVLAAFAVAVVLAVVAVLERNEAEEQRDEAVRQAQVAQSRELASAAVSQLQIDPELSVLLAERAASISPTIEAERALRRALALSHVEVDLRGHRDWVAHAAFSPDGERVVTASRDGRAGLWEASTGANIAWLEGHRDRVSWAEFSPDGELVATASRDGTARIWDAFTGEARARLDGHKDFVSRLAFSPTGRRLVTAGRDATARIWDVATGKSLATLRGHSRWVTRVEYTADGGTIVTASEDGSVRLWDAGSGAPQATLRPGGRRVLTLAVSPADGRIFGFGYVGRNAAVLWDSSTGRELRRLPNQGSLALSAAFSDDGRLLATGHSDGAVRLRSAASGKLLSTLADQGGPITELAFGAGDSRLLTASGDGTARLWDVRERRVIEELRGHDGWVTTAAFAPNGRTVLTASQDGTARIWDATAGESREELDAGPLLVSASFTAEPNSVLTAGALDVRLWDLSNPSPELVLPNGDTVANDADLSPDGSLVVTAGQDGVARLWTSGGELAKELRGHQAKLNSVAFSPDGASVVTASDDGTARLWEVDTGRSRTLAGHRADVRSAGFSPDGTLVVTAGGRDRTARIWDAPTGEQLRVLRGHSNIVIAAAFGPDGERIVTASGDNSARIWDADSGRALTVLNGHRDLLFAARFSPDGRSIVTASLDGTARVWDAATGEPLLVLLGDGHPITDAGFDPAGRRIVTAGLGVDPTRRQPAIGAIHDTARIYDCAVCGPLDELRSAARAQVTRGLTAAERREFLGE
jgi:WD40 repeat protein